MGANNPIIFFERCNQLVVCQYIWQPVQIDLKTVMLAAISLLSPNIFVKKDYKLSGTFAIFFLIQAVKKVTCFFFHAVTVCLLFPSEIVAYSSEDLKSVVQFCSKFIFSTVHKNNLLASVPDAICLDD